MSAQNQQIKALKTLHGKIEALCQNTRIDSKNIDLIAVSKTFPPEHIIPLLQAGHKNFGENRVQEAQKKWTTLKQHYPDTCLHLIGPLQSNKVQEAVQLFDVIHTLDREKLAHKLAQEMQKQEKSCPLFIQINIGEEAQKSGLLPHEADDFIKLCKTHYRLTIWGLMCIPPIDAHPAPYFALLDKIATRNGLEKRSMGMSADYQIAIELGATHIRVGSAIFGERNSPHENTPPKNTSL